MPVYDHLTCTLSNLNTSRTEIRLVMSFFRQWSIAQRRRRVVILKNTLLWSLNSWNVVACSRNQWCFVLYNRSVLFSLSGLFFIIILEERTNTSLSFSLRECYTRRLLSSWHNYSQQFPSDFPFLWMFIKFLEKTTFARHQQIFTLPLPYLAVWKAKEGVSVYHRPHSLLVRHKSSLFLGRLFIFKRLRDAAIGFIFEWVSVWGRSKCK